MDLGTRDEPLGLSGAAHFIEHMVFKGTRKRSGFEIAKSLEEVGGELNAYTSREYTCFHATCLREHLDLAVDVLADIVTRATFKLEDFKTERQVVLHEIDMSVDDLEEYIFDAYFERVYQGHPLGRPILGTASTLNGMGRSELEAYYRRHYHGRHLIVSVAGNVDHDRVVEMVEKLLGNEKRRAQPTRRKKPPFKPFRDHLKRPSEQVHILMGSPAGSFRDKLRFESYIVSAILGGGMTSRLYQKIREEQGLAYSVYTSLVSFTDSGLLTTYGSTAAKNVSKVVRLMRNGLLKFAQKGPFKSELKHFMTQVKGQILLGADDVENRMNSLAINELVFGEYRTVDQVIDQLSQVSVDSTREFLERYLSEDNLNLLLVGDLSDRQAEEIFKLMH